MIRGLRIKISVVDEMLWSFEETVVFLLLFFFSFFRKGFRLWTLIRGQHVDEGGSRFRYTVFLGLRDCFVLLIKLWCVVLSTLVRLSHPMLVSNSAVTLLPLPTPHTTPPISSSLPASSVVSSPSSYHHHHHQSPVVRCCHLQSKGEYVRQVNRHVVVFLL